MSTQEKKLDVKDVKQAARNRWPEVLSQVAGIPLESLDGKHHPCPRCGGSDRFRAFDDFAETGGIHCNQCAKKIGDGVSAVMWALNCDFPEALTKIADCVGVYASEQQAVAKPKKDVRTFATLEDAIADVERRKGKSSAQWHYHDAKGELVGAAVRWNHAPDDKEVLPFALLADGWANCAMPVPRPLYHLPELGSADVVVVTEGEKACEAARSLGYVATTSSGGSAAAKKTDWSPLAGKEVVLSPDNDKSGEDYLSDVVEQLAKLSPRPTVKVVRLPDLPPKGDIVDWIDANPGKTPEEMWLRLQGMIADASPIELPEEPTSDTTESTEPSRREITYQRITSAELDSGNYELEYLIPGVMVAGQPMIVAGPQKSLKTSLLVDLAVSLSTSGHFLGYFPVQRAARVCVMSGESGLATLQETARRVCDAAGTRLSDLSVIWSPDLPRFDSPDHLDALAEFLQGDEIEVLVIDPAYLTMPAADAGNLMAQGELLRSITMTCGRVGVQLVLAHHTKKNRVNDRFEPLALEDIAWAGFQEFARQWLLINRREEYEPGSGEHRMWLATGGSAGHGGLYGLDVSEGVLTQDSARTWDVSVSTGTNAKQEAKKRQDDRKVKEQERKDGDNCRRVLETLKKLADGATKSMLRDIAGLNTTALNKAVSTLAQEGRITPCIVTRDNGQEYDGWKCQESPNPPPHSDTRTHSDSPGQKTDCPSEITPVGQDPFRGPSVRLSDDIAALAECEDIEFVRVTKKGDGPCRI